MAEILEERAKIKKSNCFLMNSFSFYVSVIAKEFNSIVLFNFDKV
jgi:hypothetical protein